MTGRLIRSGMVAASAVVLMAAPMSMATVVAKQKPVPEVSGTWKLNVDASVNPNGPAPAAAAPAKPASSGGGGGGGRGGGGGLDLSGGAAQPVDTQLGPEENGRLQKALAGFRQAPPNMALKATPADVIIAFDPDPAKGKMWKHTTDDKKQNVATPYGPVEAKVKWNGATLHREMVMNSAGGLKIIEDYVLSSDGKQLIMTVKASSVMSPTPKIQNVEIKRVYDRVQ